MPLSVATFAERLCASGLLSRADVEALLRQIPPDRQPRDGQDLARELVRRKWLTEYQARELFKGRVRGLVLGDYRVLDQIAVGGMGDVFKAEHRRMERVVALKVLKESLLDSPKAVERFQREVRAVARLDHPNVVAAYDAGEADGRHYLAMQYVDGPNLKVLVRDRGPLPPGPALDYFLQAALGLEYAHAAGVVHRDVKPSNLLVDRKGLVKVLDLGLARLEDDLRAERPSDAPPGRLTVRDQMLGTADYMSPEQANDTRVADARSDIYSLGCTLYYLLTGKPPYPGDTVAQTLLAHHQSPIPSLRAVRNDVPEQVDAIFARMLAKQPHERYQSLSEVLAALEATGAASINPLAARASRPLAGWPAPASPGPPAETAPPVAPAPAAPPAPAVQVLPGSTGPAAVPPRSDSSDAGKDETQAYPKKSDTSAG
jgi:serine/threonine protein kinase